MKTGKELGGILSQKKEYDAIIIGGGGHGLATAFYLAKKHNITNMGKKYLHYLGNFWAKTTINTQNY